MTWEALGECGFQCKPHLQCQSQISHSFSQSKEPLLLYAKSGQKDANMLYMNLQRLEMNNVCGTISVMQKMQICSSPSPTSGENTKNASFAITTNCASILRDLSGVLSVTLSHALRSHVTDVTSTSCLL